MRCRTGCMSSAKRPAQSLAPSRRTTRSGPMLVASLGVPIAGAVLGGTASLAATETAESVGLGCGFRSDASSEPTLAGDDEDGGWLIAVLTILTERAARTSIGRAHAGSARNHSQVQRGDRTDRDSMPRLRER